MANPDIRLALYIKCKEWGALPEKGGIYDQDPEVLEAFEIISYEIAKVEEKKQKEQERQSKRRR